MRAMIIFIYILKGLREEQKNKAIDRMGQDLGINQLILKRKYASCYTLLHQTNTMPTQI